MCSYRFFDRKLNIIHCPLGTLNLIFANDHGSFNINTMVTNRTCIIKSTAYFMIMWCSFSRVLISQARFYCLQTFNSSLQVQSIKQLKSLKPKGMPNWNPEAWQSGTLKRSTGNALLGDAFPVSPKLSRLLLFPETCKFLKVECQHFSSRLIRSPPRVGVKQSPTSSVPSSANSQFRSSTDTSRSSGTPRSNFELTSSTLDLSSVILGEKKRN